MSKIHRLTPVEISRTSKLGWLADGGGLYLRIRKNGSKSWVFRNIKFGKRTDISLGSVNTITLPMAREIAAECRLAALEGRSIKAVLKRDDKPKTFLDAAIAITQRRKASWKSDKTAIKWRRGLMDHCKSLHSLPVGQITVKDIEDVLAPLWYTQNHSARETRGRIEQALDLATVLGWREGDNPARWKGGLEHLLPDHKPKVRHQPALPYKQAPLFYRTLTDSLLDTRRALAFNVLTASRGHMVREAVWSEFDIEAREWIIPASRMKQSDEDHIVPLTGRMIALLPEAGSGLVFPYRGKGFSENAFKSALKALGYNQYTAHGFRSTFKDWAADNTDFPDEVSELALAHKVGSSVRRAYRRGAGMAKRRQLMQTWCEFLHDTGRPSI